MLAIVSSWDMPILYSTSAAKFLQLTLPSSSQDLWTASSIITHTSISLSVCLLLLNYTPGIKWSYEGEKDNKLWLSLHITLRFIWFWLRNLVWIQSWKFAEAINHECDPRLHLYVLQQLGNCPSNLFPLRQESSSAFLNIRKVSVLFVVSSTIPSPHLQV